MRRLLAVTGALLCAGVLGAQAPTITDSIYGLSVDSAQYPRFASVLLLDDGVVSVEADGRHTATYRQVRQVLRERAVAGLEEQQLVYDPTHEKLTVNWLRVVRPNGEVVSEKPSQTQESDVPADMDVPVYVSRKVLRASLSGVAPGTLVDFSYTRQELKPFRSGDFFTTWSVLAGTSVRRSRFQIDAPQDMKLLIDEHNIPFARIETTTHGRTTYAWATSDVPWVKSELFAADSNGVDELIRVAAPGSWSDIGRWYAGLARDRYTATRALRDTVHALVAHQKTLDDSLRAIHRWVAQDIRYVSIDLGIGGFQPRSPDSVIHSGFGDCKDKATLFVAALGVLGIEAYPVLLNAGGHVDRALPTIGQFDHAIAAIKRGGKYEYTDLTSGVTPLGQLPGADESEFGLIVHTDGRTEEVTLPLDTPDATRLESRIIGTLSPDGTFEGRMELHATGAAADAMRANMRQRFDSAQRTNFVRSMAQSTFPGAEGDSLVAFDGKDLAADARFSFHLHHGRASSQSGTTDVLTVPLTEIQGGAYAAQLNAESPRRYPIDASKVVGRLSTLVEVRITLPKGWHARLPRSVTATSRFGTYESEYTQDGDELILRRRTRGATGILPPWRVGELSVWFARIGSDHVPVILIDHS